MNGAAVLKQIKPVIVFKGSEFARKNIKSQDSGKMQL